MTEGVTGAPEIELWPGNCDSQTKPPLLVVCVPVFVSMTASVKYPHLEAVVTVSMTA
jgi:hypothetical protein